MVENEAVVRPRSSIRLYGIIIVCLGACLGIAFLIHKALQEGDAKGLAGKAAAAHRPGVQMASDSLKREPDTLAQPLLARLQKSPDDPVLLAEIGKIYYQARQFHTAAEYYKNSVRVKPDTGTLVKLGGAHHFDGDDDAALGAWNRALQLDPTNADALFNIGFVQWQERGNRKEAIAAWQKLLRTNPNHPKRAQVEELLTQAKRHAEIPASGSD